MTIMCVIYLDNFYRHCLDRRFEILKSLYYCIRCGRTITFIGRVESMAEVHACKIKSTE